jgi:hypothetical protein
VYIICIHPAVDLGIARRERNRICRRTPFRTNRRGLGTIISQRLTFRALARRRRLLAGGVIQPTEVTSLVAGRCEPMTCGLLELATLLAAVALPSVVGSADAKCPQASPATQLKDHQLAHPS